MFEELFYFIYRFSSKIKSARTPALSSYLLICVLIGFNIMTIGAVLCYHFNVNLVRDFNVNSTYEGLTLGSVIMIINYFKLYSKRKTIFEKYESQEKHISPIRSFLYTLYIIFTFVLFFVVASKFVVPLSSGICNH